MSNLANGIHSVARRASDAAAVGERADPALVRADRVEQLYSQLPLGLAATVVIGVIAAVELHEGRLIALLVVWGGLLASVVILHGLLYRSYRQDARRTENAEPPCPDCGSAAGCQDSRMRAAWG